MDEEAFKELLKSFDVPDGTIEKISAEMLSVKEEKVPFSEVVDSVDQIIALIDLQLMYETDWRKRAQLVMKKISLGIRR